MNAIRTRLTLTAGLVIIALTAAAFWLSYAHLHDVAAASGLGDSPARAWAWPATLDLFIVAGEVMMLVAALAKRRDGWAIGLTVAGSIGSIGLNVYGVGAGAAKIEYLVAAVPPSAALLAFGALMRQVHHAIAGEGDTAGRASEEATAPFAGPLAVVNDTAEDLPTVDWSKVFSGPLTVLPDAPTVTPVDAGLKEVLDEEAQTEDLPEPDETEASVYVVATKPTLADIGKAVEDLAREQTPLSGANLAAYFGVSARSGRRYLSDWTKSQEHAA